MTLFQKIYAPIVESYLSFYTVHIFLLVFSFLSVYHLWRLKTDVRLDPWWPVQAPLSRLEPGGSACIRLL